MGKLFRGLVYIGCILYGLDLIVTILSGNAIYVDYMVLGLEILGFFFYLLYKRQNN